ncbi:MAG: hypothetical protein V1816_25720 [Pseudomonadota bacterium]
MKTAKIVSLGLAVFLFVLFVVQNLQVLTQSEPLKLNLLLTSFSTPPLMVALMLIVCFALGFASAWCLGFSQSRKLKKTIKDFKAKQIRIEAELKSLRNLPIKGEPGAPAARAPAVVEGG